MGNDIIFYFFGILIYFIKKQINEAEKLKEEAKNILSEHEKKISNSKSEMKLMIEKQTKKLIRV